MNKLTTAKRIQIVTALVEGVGIRATARLAGVTKGAVSKLLADVGTVASEFHNLTVRNVQSARIQADEIWSFCYAKERAIKRDPSIKERNADAGDIWTWTAIDADTKLMISYMVGPRRPPMAYHIMRDLRERVSTVAPQVSTDNLPWYAQAIDRYFGIDVDFGTITKIFSASGDGRYSPPVCIGCKKSVVTGDPDPKHISTSHIERSNLTMRMHMRRFTRLTNGHSKKVAMHCHAVALHFLYYNFAKIHETLRVTPAMAAGIATTAWTVADIVTLLERAEAAA